MNPLKKANPLTDERERELLKDSQSYIYKDEDGIELGAHCFFPEKHDPAELKPAILFFHGGLWDVSIISQFAAHCMHFASRGMVAMTLEYRVSSIHNSSPEDATYDAQDAVLWAKKNHTILGIDPEKIIVAGAASGANMALSTAMIADSTTATDDMTRPMAVIGLSSIVNTTKKGHGFELFRDPAIAVKYSPSKNIRKNIVPILLVHGKADSVISHDSVVKFVKAMKRKKNDCEFIDYEAANHSFFNFNVSAQHFELTLNTMDSFITRLGCIEPIEYD